MGARQRIGVYGGTFDPPHIGHLVTAERAAEVLGTERMLLMVANDPWQKTAEVAVTPAALRHEMVVRAAERSTLVEPSDLELRRDGPTFTIDTLHELERSHPDAELYLVLGADALRGLQTWKDPEEVRRLARLAVLGRPGHVIDDDTLRPGDVVVPVPRLEVSSTEVRERVAQGRSVRYLVPDPVIAVIHRHGLYRGAR